MSYHLWFFFKNIIVQVRYITIETKEAVRIGYNGFHFRIRTQVKKKPGIFNTGRFSVLILLYHLHRYIIIGLCS